MKSLRDLLLTHKVPGVAEAETRRICASVLSNITSIAILPKQIKYQDGILSLAVPPIVKSALLIKFEMAKEALAHENITIREIR